jgi:CAP12/Pycsar effector protein, TIR domain
MATPLRRPSAEVEEIIDRFVQVGTDLMADSENLNSVADIEEWVHKTERWHALTRDALRESYADDGAAAEEFYNAATGGIFAQWGQSEGEEFGNRRKATDRGIRTLISLKDRLEFAEEASDASEQTEPASTKDPRRVMVVHGRNAAAQKAIFMFLRALGLSPTEWEDAVAATGTASPHNLAAVRAAMDLAQAVIVILTAEDQAGLLPELAEEGSAEVLLEGQPRQNVMLEAGMAMGIDPTHTILVQDRSHQRRECNSAHGTHSLRDRSGCRCGRVGWGDSARASPFARNVACLRGSSGTCRRRAPRTCGWGRIVYARLRSPRRWRRGGCLGRARSFP